MAASFSGTARSRETVASTAAREAEEARAELALRRGLDQLGEWLEEQAARRAATLVHDIVRRRPGPSRGT